MGTKHDDGCFQHAMDDESLFTILARDPSGPDTIRHWVMLREAMIGRGEKPLEDHHMLEEALATAQDMVTWRDEATDGRTRGSYRWQLAKVTQETAEILEVENTSKEWQHMYLAVQKREAAANALLKECGILFRRYSNEHLSKCTPESDKKAQVDYDMLCKIVALVNPDKEIPPIERKGSTSAKAALPMGGHPVDWAMTPFQQIGNRFRVWADDDNKWWLAEIEGDKWTGGYPIQHSLQADIIKAAYNDWHTATHEPVRSIKTHDEPDHTAPSGRRTVAEPALGAPYVTASQTAEQIIEAVANSFGTTYEKMAEDFGRVHTASSDTVDVTDTPEMPPHRFTIFTKSKGWAYGRGLEINPSHIPDMLDRMAADGWNLQCVLGGVEPTKVGMIFRRYHTGGVVTPPEKPKGPWNLIGTLGGLGVWVDGKMQTADIQCIKDAIADTAAHKGKVPGPMRLASRWRGHNVYVPESMPLDDRLALQNMISCGTPTDCTGAGRGIEP